MEQGKIQFTFHENITTFIKKVQTLEAIGDITTFKISSNGVFCSATIGNNIEVHSLCNSPVFSENIHSSYLKNGVKSLSSLPPEFAFILHDKTDNSVLFAVDCFATKPLFYQFYEGQLCINTDLASLVDTVNACSINFKKIEDYFRWETDEQPVDNLTFYDSIFRLLPAHFGRYRNGNLEILNYWQLNLENTQAPDLEHIKNIKDSFLAAINKRISSHKIAANLSGGLDSSAIVAAIGTQKELTINTIYYDSETKEANEIAFANEVAKCFETTHYTIKTPENSYESLKEITKIISQPDPGILPSFIHLEILKKTQESGINLLFSGHGGDSIVGYGFEYPQHLLRTNQWKVLKQQCQNYDGVHDGVSSFAKRVFTEEIKFKVKEKRFLEVASLFFIATFYFKINYFTYFLKKNTESQLPDYKYFEKNILLENKDTSALKNVKLFDSKALFGSFNKDEKSYIDYNFISLGINGNETISLLGHRLDSGVSFPFFDPKLLEKSVRIPSRLRFGNGFTRGTIREALAGILPKKIKNRTTKADFTNYANTCYIALYDAFKGDFKENHQLWEIINKSVFDELSNCILNKEINPNQKARYTWLGMRVINLGLWLNDFNNHKNKN